MQSSHIFFKCLYDAGRDWGQEEKGMTKDETAGWHHQLDGHEFEQVPGDGEGQGSLACCSPWGSQKSGKTEQLGNRDPEPVKLRAGTLKSANTHGIHLAWPQPSWRN